MFSEDQYQADLDEPLTAAGVDHVRLWYHYLNAGDPDAYGSLLDADARIFHPNTPPGRGRRQVVEHNMQLARLQAHHRIHKIVADGNTIAVMGRYASMAGGREGEGEFADFFTLARNGLLLTCRRYYFVAP